jgi:hypothetical protein
MAAALGRVERTSGLANSRPLRAIDGGCRLRGGYRRVGPVFVRRRGVTLGVAVLMLVGVWFLTRDLGNEFLPQVDSGNVGVFLRLPPGASAEETNRVALEVEEIVRGMPYVEHMFTTAGGSFFGSSTAARSGRGSLDIVLTPSSRRDMSADEWVMEAQRRIDERVFPGARIFVRPPRIRGLRTSSSGESIAITIQGDDLAILNRLADEIIGLLDGVPGLENSSLHRGGESPADRPSRPRARGDSVSTWPRSARRCARRWAGRSRPVHGGESRIRRPVILPRAQFRSSEDLETVALFPGAGGGAPIYLRDVATVTRAWPDEHPARAAEPDPPGQRRRADRRRPAGAVSDSIEARLAAFELPDGYGIVMGGEAEAIRENNRQLMIVILLAIFLVFVVLAIQYESFTDPLVILLAIPLSLIGVGLGLWITDTPQSAPVLLGSSCWRGSSSTTRFSSSSTRTRIGARAGSARGGGRRGGRGASATDIDDHLTTVFRHVALALGLGEGSTQQPLAIAVVSGMFLSMALTLFVVPGAYVGMNRRGAPQGGSWGGGKRRTTTKGKPAADRRPCPPGYLWERARPIARVRAVCLLHVEPDVRDVAVGHRVVAPLAPDEAHFLRALHRAPGAQEVLPADDLRPDEPARHVRVDRAGRLDRRVPLMDRPRPDLLGTRGEERLEAQQVVCGMDHAAETRLGEPDVGEERVPIFARESRELGLEIAAHSDQARPSTRPRLAAATVKAPPRVADRGRHLLLRTFAA